MSFSGSGDGLSKNERRDAARAKAKALRDQQKKKEKRNRAFLQGGIGLAVIAVVAVVVLVIVGNTRPVGPGPLNMQSDGITIGKNFKAVSTPAIPANGKPVATKRDKTSSVVNIRIYLDYFCPYCNQFETTNKEQISALVKSGAATLEIHPISLLDRSSLGTRYASRSANAAACVANYSPNDFWAFTQEMYVKQPTEETAGLTNKQILAIVKSSGASRMSDITSCVNTEKFKSWVTAATDRALAGPLPDSNISAVSGTPTVLVDGQQYTGALDDASAFQSFIVQAAGASFNENSTSTPTPSASPSASATPTP